jgi:hypothetical protein
MWQSHTWEKGGFTNWDPPRNNPELGVFDFIFAVIPNALCLKQRTPGVSGAGVHLDEVSGAHHGVINAWIVDTIIFGFAAPFVRNVDFLLLKNSFGKKWRISDKESRTLLIHLMEVTEETLPFPRIENLSKIICFDLFFANHRWKFHQHG